MKRYITMGLALLTLVLIYLFQKVSYAEIINGVLPPNMSLNNPYGIFIFNRTLRLILNDIACMLLIWSLFQEVKYVQVAFVVFLVELLVILPVYFLIKLNLEGTSELSSPFLSQIHRIIINPLLMIILILGFFYQKVSLGKRV
jgi:exosortase F-associated protein